MAETRSARQRLRLGKPQREGGRRYQNVVMWRCNLLFENLQIAGVVERERAARQQPRHDRGRECSKRRWRDCRQDIRFRRHAALKHDSKPARDQLDMIARNGAETVGGDVESDDSWLSRVELGWRVEFGAGVH